MQMIICLISLWLLIGVASYVFAQMFWGFPIQFILIHFIALTMAGPVTAYFVLRDIIRDLRANQ